MKSQTSAVHAATALRPGAVRDAIVDRLERALGKPLQGATRRDIYDALTLAIREELAERWIATGTRVKRARVKRVCYLSMEFLLGRSLINALTSFEDGLLEEVRETVESLGHDLDRIAAEEEDPGLGNGGLGRLAACFLDSLATSRKSSAKMARNAKLRARGSACTTTGNAGTAACAIACVSVAAATRRAMIKVASATNGSIRKMSGRSVTTCSFPAIAARR